MTAPINSIVKVVSGSTTLQQTATTGVCYFDIPSYLNEGYAESKLDETPWQ